jgi:N-acetylmuramoyl-L-alanine amidase
MIKFQSVNRGENMKPKKVILHCSDTPDSAGDKYGAKDIDLWHRERGFEQIGYHRVIRRTGVAERGRSDNVPGAHTLHHNSDSLGICYIGRRSPSVDQVVTLLALYSEFKQKYQIDYLQWFGHYEFTDKKICPGFDMRLFRFLLKLFEDVCISLDDRAFIKSFLQYLTSEKNQIDAK